MLRDKFPQGRFAPPATEEQLRAVESTLGVRFPAQLRALYLECDGFREDRGNAKYLLSLTDEDSIGSLVTTTRFHWSEVGKQWPRLDLSPYIFFGSSSGDEMWGIKWQGAEQIIAYHHHMGGEFEVMGSKIIDVYLADYELYEKAEEPPK